MASVDRGPPQGGEEGGEAWGAEFEGVIGTASDARDKLMNLAIADQDGAAGSDARVSSDNKAMAAKILSSLAPVTSLTVEQAKVDGVSKKTFEGMAKILNEAANNLENRVTKDPHSVGEFVADILTELRAIDGVKELIESGTTKIPDEIIGRIGIEWVVDEFNEVMKESSPEELKQKLLEVVDKTHTMVMAEVRGRKGVGTKSTKDGIRLQTFTSIRDFFVGIANRMGGKGTASKSAVVSETQTKVDGYSGKIAVLKGKLLELESLPDELQNNKDSLASLKESRQGLSPTLTEVKLEKRQVEIKARLAVLTPKKDAITIELAEVTALQKAGAWRTSEKQGDGLEHTERASGPDDGGAANAREDVIGYGGETVSLSRMGASADHGAGFIQGEGKVAMFQSIVDSYKKLIGSDNKETTIKKLEAHTNIQTAINAGLKQGRKPKAIIADLYAGTLAANGTHIRILKLPAGKEIRFTKGVASKKFAKNNMTLSCKSLRKDIEELQEVKAGLISAGASPMDESVKKIDSQISLLTEKLEARQEVCEAQSVSVISASIDSYMDSLSTDTAPHGQIFNKVGEGAETTYQIADQARYDKFLASPEGFAFASGQWMEADFVLVDPKNKKLELGMLEDQAETMTRLREKLHISFDGNQGANPVSHQSGSWGIHMPKIRMPTTLSAEGEEVVGKELGKKMSYGGMMVSFPLNSPKLAKDPTVLEINKREARVLVDQSVSYRMHLSGALETKIQEYLIKGGLTEEGADLKAEGMTLRAKVKWMEKNPKFKDLLKDPGVSSIVTAFNDDEARLKKAEKYLEFSMQEVSSRELTQALVDAMPAHMKAQLSGGEARYDALRQAINSGDIKSIAKEIMAHADALIPDDSQRTEFMRLLSDLVEESTFDAEMSAVASPPKKRSIMTMGSTIDLGELAMGRGVKTRVRCKSAKDRTLILVAAFAARFVNMKKKKRGEKPINESMARARFMYQGLGLEVCSENVGRPGSKANLAAVGPALIYGQAFSALKAAYYGKKQST